MPTKDRPQPADKSDRRKDERVEIRLDPELAQRAREKAIRHGWTVSSVLRALLEMWTEEDVISPEDVGRHTVRAKKAKK